MNDAEFDALITDGKARSTRYKERVPAYFRRVTMRLLDVGCVVGGPAR